ncbi:MAG: hypothetical protein JSR85_06285 [Proteobacteria bacterium]|nr:hypothetical protein [Pseudomonadota bacterium]
MKRSIIHIILCLIPFSPVAGEGIAHIYYPKTKAYKEVKLPGKGPTILTIKSERCHRIDNIKFEEGESADITINPNCVVSVIYQPKREKQIG